jgi:hypothetical protein
VLSHSVHLPRFQLRCLPLPKELESRVEPPGVVSTNCPRHVTPTSCSLSSSAFCRQAQDPRACSSENPLCFYLGSQIVLTEAGSERGISRQRRLRTSLVALQGSETRIQKSSVYPSTRKRGISSDGDLLSHATTSTITGNDRSGPFEAKFSVFFSNLQYSDSGPWKYGC